MVIISSSLCFELQSVSKYFWDFSMFYQIFLSPQVKWCAIITYKHGIYELPNDLRLRKLGNIKKLSKIHRIIAHRQLPQPKWKPHQYHKKAPEKWKTNPPAPAARHPTAKPESAPDTPPAILPGNILWPQLTPDPLKPNFLDTFGSSKAFHTALTQN